MKWKKVWSFLLKAGIPWFFIASGSGIAWKIWYITAHPRAAPISGDDIQTIYILSAVLMGFVFLRNSQWDGTGKKIGLFTWLQKYIYEPPLVSERKKRAQNPEIPEKYLSPKPDGLVLGYDKRTKQYVRFPLKKGNARSLILLGTPGSGKSTLLLTTILAQRFMRLPEEEMSNGDGSRNTFFLLDLKPELLKKCSLPGDDKRDVKSGKKIVEINISDRSKYGWDPYYRLKECQDDDEVLQQLDIISRALIDGGKGAERNEFFYQSAQVIFSFLALERWKMGRSFMQTVKDILAADLQTEIKKVLDRIKGRIEYRKIESGLIAYGDKQGDAFNGIEMSMRQGLACMARDDVTYFFGRDDTDRTASPYLLEEKVSMALTIPSNRLKTFKTIIRLIVMQIIDHCEQRDEENSHLITLCLDEVYRLGSICDWVDFLTLCRSKNVSCWLAMQSLALMEKLYDKPTTERLMQKQQKNPAPQPSKMKKIFSLIQDTQENQRIKESSSADTAQPLLFICFEHEIMEFPLAGKQLLGRPSKDKIPDIPVTNKYISRKHGIFETAYGKVTYTPSNSSNGTLLGKVKLTPDEPITLQDGDELIIPASDGSEGVDVMLVCALSQNRINIWRDLMKTSKDPLTGLSGRNAFKTWYLMNCSWNKELKMCLFLLDIDKFKTINDVYGHASGDNALKVLSDQLKETAGENGHICRWGGDEFTGIIMGSDVEVKKKLDDMRQRIRNIVIDNRFSMTISAGVLDISDFNSNDIDHLVSIVDKALYKAKEKGRDKVCLAKVQQK